MKIKVKNWKALEKVMFNPRIRKDRIIGIGYFNDKLDFIQFESIEIKNKKRTSKVRKR